MEQRPKFARLEEDASIIRDLQNNALLTIDNKALNKYKLNKERAKNSKKRILEYENDINTLRNEVSEIKEALKLILNKIN